MSTPRETLIERWLPTQALGVESQRERGASSALPPLYFLHVWWARRPLTASRAAVLGSLLPAWSERWPTRLRSEFPSEGAYRAWFQRLIGILGDPVAARRLIDYANARQIKLEGNPYGQPRAFTINPAEEDLVLLRELLALEWGDSDVTVLDPMAGGGSIPFEALRYGLRVIANELNPVAAVILDGTLRYPLEQGEAFAERIVKAGRVVAEKVKRELREFYPREDGETIFAYVWARTVACPDTGREIPLSPNWWLQKKKGPVAVRLLQAPEAARLQFQILRGKELDGYDPDIGTIRRGTAVSPWTGQVVAEDYVKREAQAGRLGHRMYAIVSNGPEGRRFRQPSIRDEEAVVGAAHALEMQQPRWEARDRIPDEAIPDGLKTSELLRYGMRHWRDLFSPRQLLAALVASDAIEEVLDDTALSGDESSRAALATYLYMAQAKALNFNSALCRYQPDYGIRTVFDRHDFAMKWSYAEFDAANSLFPWAVDQVVDAYTGISRLQGTSRRSIWQGLGSESSAAAVKVLCESASRLRDLPDESVTAICVDPPYYDNVQYSELADFFYVWAKRTLASDHASRFRADLGDKDDEAVANPYRFRDFGRSRTELAKKDYESKMDAVFRELYRVLRSDGVLTVMFTHKRVEAWDTLASSLIGAGFRITASWPIHTEMANSLSIRGNASAQTTILLACRKRIPSSEVVWWDDLKAAVKGQARERAEALAKDGFAGVDLYISAFGPALSVISERWPVLTSDVDESTGQPMVVRPEAALDLAREEVLRLRKEGLLRGRLVTFDPVTDWYLMAWDAFRAEEFPADEARKLAIAVGIDAMEEVLVRRERLISKKQGSVVLQQPKARRKQDIVDPDAGSYPVLIDAVHTAMLVHDEDGLPACREFLRRTGYLTDGTFRACVQALLNAIPRTRDKRGFVRPEAATLDAMRNAFFDELVVPPEEDVELSTATQTTLAWGGDEGAEEELEESDETEEE